MYTQPDPSAQTGLFAQLAEAEAKLDLLQQQLTLATAATAGTPQPAIRDVAHGRFLGEKTTGLKVEPKLRMEPLPTGAYPVMDPVTDPLLSVTVENVSRDIRRVCVKAFIEGLSAQAIRTVEVEPRQPVTLNLQPTLFPERRTGDHRNSTGHFACDCRRPGR